MIPSRENLGHEPSLIEDVLMPHAEKFTDPRRAEVRRRSIGNLQRQYLRRKFLRKPARGAERPASSSERSMSILPSRRYSVVPPLQTLHSSADSLPGFPVASLLLLAAPLEAARFLGRKLSQTKRWVTSAFTSRLPKRYSLAAGASPDWEETAWKARYVVPVVLILFILSLLLFGLLGSPGHTPGGKSGNVTRVPVVQGLFTNGNSKPGKGDSSHGSASAATLPGANTSSSSGSTSPTINSISPVTTSGSGGSGGTGSTVGGLGGGPGGGAGGTGGTGGSVSIPDCSLGQVATVTCLVTACSPAVTLQPGQKAILGVDGTCVVLN